MARNDYTASERRGYSFFVAAPLSRGVQKHGDPPAPRELRLADRKPWLQFFTPLLNLNSAAI